MRPMGWVGRDWWPEMEAAGERDITAFGLVAVRKKWAELAGSVCYSLLISRGKELWWTVKMSIRCSETMW